jgi:hypothetical protein
MRAYRIVWQVSVTTLAAVALLAAGTSLGWFVVLATVGSLALLGACGAYAWVEDRAYQRRAMVQVASWSAGGTLLWIGLPPLIGPWTILVVAVLGALCPQLVGWLVEHRTRTRSVRTPRQAERLRTRDLERRWQRTTQELRDRRIAVAAALVLVEERALLLDELERRDPAGFQALLVRAGWREPQDQ